MQRPRDLRSEQHRAGGSLIVPTHPGQGSPSACGPRCPTWVLHQTSSQNHPWLQTLKLRGETAPSAKGLLSSGAAMEDKHQQPPATHTHAVTTVLKRKTQSSSSTFSWHLWPAGLQSEQGAAAVPGSPSRTCEWVPPGAARTGLTVLHVCVGVLGTPAPMTVEPRVSKRKSQRNE